MSQGQPLPEPTEQDARLTAYLFDLLEVGAEIARSIGRQADRQAQPDAQTPTTDLAEQFERVSRAMRRNILLVRHLAQPAAARHPASNRTQARQRSAPEAADAVHARTEPSGKLDPPETEPRDRLDSPEPQERLPNRPVQHIINGIRRDLGLEARPAARPHPRRSRHKAKALRHNRAAPRPPDAALPPPHGPAPKFRPPRDPDRHTPNIVQRAVA